MVAHLVACSPDAVVVAFGPHLAALDLRTPGAKPAVARYDGKVDATIRAIAIAGSLLVSIAEDKSLKVCSRSSDVALTLARSGRSLHSSSRALASS